MKYVGNSENNHSNGKVRHVILFYMSHKPSVYVVKTSHSRVVLLLLVEFFIILSSCFSPANLKTKPTDHFETVK